MKSNAKCWTPPGAAPLIATLWLSACATGVFDGNAPCPPVVEYSPDDQSLAAEEVEALPEAALIVQMLADYSVLRDQAKACK